MSKLAVASRQVSRKEVDALLATKELPKALDFEMVVLGAILSETGAFQRVKDVLAVEQFYEDSHKFIYSAVEKLDESNAPVDILTVMNQLKLDKNLDKIGGPGYLAELTNRVGSAANIEYHARIIHQKYMSRVAIQDCSNFLVKFLNEDGDIFELRNKLSDGLRVVPPNSFFRLSNFNKAIEEGESMPDLHKMFGHLWNKNEVAFMFGPTGAGKSILSIQIAHCLSKGLDVVPNILPNECGPQKVLYIDFELTGRNLKNRYSNRDINFQFDEENLMRASINPDFLEFDDRLDKIAQTQIENLILTFNPEVLIVDNITFLTSESNQDADVAKRLMKKLVFYKRKYGLSLLVIAHTTKTNSNPFLPIELADMAGSAQLSIFADAIFGIKPSALDDAVKYIKQFKDRNEPQQNKADNVISFEAAKGGAEYNFLMFEFLRFSREIEHLATPEDDEAMDLRIGEAIRVMIDEKIGYTKLMKRIGWDQSRSGLVKRIKKYVEEHSEYEFNEKGRPIIQTPF